MKPINILNIYDEEALAFDLYLKHKGFVLYKPLGAPFTPENREKLIKNGVTHLYINHKAHKTFNLYTESKIKTVLNSENTIEDKCSFIYSAATSYLDELFTVDGEVDIKRTSALIENLIDYTFQATEMVDLINDIVEHNFYTYIHCVQTTALTLTLARRAFPDKSSSFHIDLGIGALLHDIGKSQVPKHIIEKIGGLTDLELKVVREHPNYGKAILLSNNIHNKIILQIVTQHHEKCDGTGYPKCLTLSEISECARLVSIVDVYVALVTDRPYRAKREPAEAYKFMENDMEGSFDPCFMKYLHDLLFSGLSFRELDCPALDSANSEFDFNLTRKERVV